MRERSRERKKDNRKPFFLLIRENEIRFLREGWLVDLWYGLVWFRSWCFTTYTHVNLGVLAWAQCDKRGCDVVSSLFFLVPDSPHYWYLEKTNADSNRTPIDKKNNGIQKKFENLIFQFSLVEVEVLKAFVEHLASVVYVGF